MRIRALKPGFFKNEHLAALSPWHRLAFEGLWLCADREGRLEDRPKRLKAEIFPYDDLDMDGLLWDLARAAFVVRYCIAGVSYISIPTWHEHQHPRPDEAESTLPTYEPATERPQPAMELPQPLQAKPVNTPDTEPSLDSDGPGTTKGIGSGVLGSGKWEVGVRGTVTPPRLKTTPVSEADYQTFCSAYPIGRRVGGDVARRAFRKVMYQKPPGHLQVMLDALEQHKRSQQWAEGKIPLMTTWLNQERWVQVLPEGKVDIPIGGSIWDRAREHAEQRAGKA